MLKDPAFADFAVGPNNGEVVPGPTVQTDDEIWGYVWPLPQFTQCSESRRPTWLTSHYFQVHPKHYNSELARRRNLRHASSRQGWSCGFAPSSLRGRELEGCGLQRFSIDPGCKYTGEHCPLPCLSKPRVRSRNDADMRAFYVQAAVYMVAEKAADLIKADWHLGS